MQNITDSKDIIHYLFTTYCTSNQERHELDKWIKKDGLDHVLSTMQSIFHNNLNKKATKSGISTLDNIQGKIYITVEYEFDTTNPSVAYFRSIDELVREIAKQDDFYKYCDDKRLVQIEKKVLSEYNSKNKATNIGGSL